MSATCNGARNWFGYTRRMRSTPHYRPHRSAQHSTSPHSTGCFYILVHGSSSPSSLSRSASSSRSGRLSKASKHRTLAFQRTHYSNLLAFGPNVPPGRPFGSVFYNKESTIYVKVHPIKKECRVRPLQRWLTRCNHNQSLSGTDLQPQQSMLRRTPVVQDRT